MGALLPNKMDQLNAVHTFHIHICQQHVHVVLKSIFPCHQGICFLRNIRCWEQRPQRTVQVRQQGLIVADCQYFHSCASWCSSQLELQFAFFMIK